jgi:hypothetical protein
MGARHAIDAQGLFCPMKWIALMVFPNRLYAGAYLEEVSKRLTSVHFTYVYAAVGVVLYVKLRRFQLPPLHSFRSP